MLRSGASLPPAQIKLGSMCLCQGEYNEEFPYSLWLCGSTDFYHRKRIITVVSLEGITSSDNEKLGWNDETLGRSNDRLGMLNRNDKQVRMTAKQTGRQR